MSTASKTEEKGWKRPSLFSILGVAAVSILGGILFSEGAALESVKNFTIASGWSLVIWVTQYYGNGYLFYLLDKRWSWLEEPVKRLIIGFIALVLYSGSAILIVNLTFVRILYGAFPEPFWNWALWNGRVAIGIALGISTIMAAIGFFRSWRTSAIQEEKLKLEMLDYKYKTLLNQVNPHFLFNSLNVLSSLVYEDQDLAVKFIKQLSKIYRYTLENRERDLVSLKDEKAFIDSYIFLLKIRFEEALNIEMELPEDEDRYLVPMALQILLENAIKHNRVSKDEALDISIYVDADRLVIKNSLQLSDNKEESIGFGLENIKKRLAYLSDEELEVKENEGEFIARLPILIIDK